MGAMHVKNISEDLHEAVRQRAEEEGMTVSDYLLTLIRRDLAVPSQRQWLAELSTRTPFNGDDIVKTLDDVRSRRDDHLLGG
jgi:plasmid stability protein